MFNSTTPSSAVIAVNRFGLGAKPGEIILAKADEKKWLKSTLTNLSFDPSLPGSDAVIEALIQYRMMKREEKSTPSGEQEMMKKAKNSPRNLARTLIVDGLRQAVSADNSISWRLLDFFSNHFSVSDAGQVMAGLAPTLEREAIAPNLLGKFEDMLLAVVKHPAMLIYLNNEKSFGPNSKQGLKRKKGMNENLAREILELHTLGVNGGYSQADVIELAKGITGWTVLTSEKSSNRGFTFNANGHEPGKRNLLGKSYPQKGVSQGESMLRDIANHPNTAKYICLKLAQHFISDKPVPSLLTKLEKVWLASQGDIKLVLHALIDAEEAWQPAQEKFKTPREFVISTLRALSITRIKDNYLLFSLTSLGQKPFNAGSPAGFGDEKSDWDGASALMARIDWANAISAMSKVNAEQVMKNSFADTLSKTSYQTITRAESRKQALTLLLMSPEFQRR